MSPAASVLLLVLAAPAAADGALAVIATGADEGLDRIAAEAEARARAVALGAGRDLVAVARAPETRSAAVARGTALVEEGAKAYAELESDVATDKLTEALATLRHELDGDGAMDAFVRALALLGSTFHQSGDTKRAEKIFRELVTVRPRYQLDPKTFPPADLKLLQDVQDDLAFTPPGKLEIESGGLPAAVFVDGRFRGVTPLSLEGVNPGRHQVLRKRQGYESRADVVDVGDGKTARVEDVLVPPEGGEETLELILGVRVDPFALHPTMLALGERLGDPEMLVMTAVADPSKGRVLCVVRAVPGEGVLLAFQEIPLKEGWPEALDKAVTEMIAPSADAVVASAVPEDKPAPAPAPVAPEDEGDGSVWLWVLGGGGGAVAVAAIVGAGVAVALLAPDLVTLPPAGGTSPTAAASHTPEQEAAAAAAQRRVVLGY